MNLFLDTNIIVDFIIDRPPYSRYAYKIVGNAKKGKYNLWSSSNSFTTSYYLAQKSLGDVKTRKLLAFLLKYIDVVDAPKVVLLNAIDSNFRDFEDAVQYYCARKIRNIECIVTRNTKDFKKSSIPVKSPEELFI